MNPAKYVPDSEISLAKTSSGEESLLKYETKSGYEVIRFEWPNTDGTARVAAPNAVPPPLGPGVQLGI